MIRLRRVKAAAAATTIAAGVAAALLIPASPAVAYNSGGLSLDIAVQSPATLLANGAAVDISIEYACNTQSTSVYVDVTQRGGGKLTASGRGYVTVGCTGGKARTTVSVPANGGGQVFVKGEAFVTASINGCSAVTCGTETDNATVVFDRR